MNRPKYLYVKWLPWISVILMLIPAASPAHDGDDHAPKPVSDEVAYGPTAMPDRIVLTWLDDPATSQAVMWRTDASVNRGFAEIARAEDGPLFVSKAKRLAAATTALTTDLGVARFHSVNFADLAPRTKYVYRVGDGLNWSEWTHFTTASDQAEPFAFVYLGDAQNDIKSLWSRVVREAYGDAPRAAFMLHAGDLVNHANNDAEWGEWFYATGFIHRMIPCIATPGNHEYQSVKDAAGKVTGIELSKHWHPMFAFPENGPPGLEETTYRIDYQGVRFVSLNSNVQLDVQSGWLDSVLADNPNRWTVVTFHHPVYSSAAGRDNPEIRSHWQPIFDKYRVDLVLQGHDHTYARTKLMAHQEERNLAVGVTRRSPTAGTVYVVSVSGPKSYPLGNRPFMQRTAEDTQLYQVISIDGDEL